MATTGRHASGEVPGRSRARPRHRVRLLLRALLLGFVAFVLLVGWSVTSALTAPGTDSVAARLAEWGRDHGLGLVVLGLEKLQYDVHPPRTGGVPRAGLLGRPGTVRTARLSRTHSAPATVALRPAMRPFARPRLPGEGTWHALLSVHGQPAVQATYVRPDSRHTSYLTGVVRMSSRLLRFELHPGFEQPGGRWTVPDWIPPGQRRGLAATWNGAFKLADARGGFYLHGRTAGTLVEGAASEVFHRDGTMTVGSWGREVRMTPDVVGVRQNLALLVDHGRIRPSVNSSPFFHWGLTIGGAYYVFRSGVGVTANGDVVYVSGDALSAQTLARILLRAGCVRAMELDINPAWVSFMTYHQRGNATNPVPKRLLPDYQRPANRYYTHTSRDFVAAYVR